MATSFTKFSITFMATSAAVFLLSACATTGQSEPEAEKPMVEMMAEKPSVEDCKAMHEKMMAHKEAMKQDGSMKHEGSMMHHDMSPEKKAKHKACMEMMHSDMPDMKEKCAAKMEKIGDDEHQCKMMDKPEE